MSRAARRFAVIGVTAIIVTASAAAATINLAGLLGLIKGPGSSGAPAAAVTLPAGPASQLQAPVPSRTFRPDAFAAAGFLPAPPKAQPRRLLQPLIRHLAKQSGRAAAVRQVEQVLGNIPRQPLQAYTHPDMPGFTLYASDGRPALAQYQAPVRPDQKPHRQLFMNVRQASTAQLADPSFLQAVLGLARGEKPGTALAFTNPPGWAMVGPSS